MFVSGTIDPQQPLRLHLQGNSAPSQQLPIPFIPLSQLSQSQPGGRQQGFQNSDRHSDRLPFPTSIIPTTGPSQRICLCHRLPGRTISRRPVMPRPTSRQLISIHRQVQRRNYHSNSKYDYITPVSVTLPSGAPVHQSTTTSTTLLRPRPPTIPRLPSLFNGKCRAKAAK